MTFCTETSHTGHSCPGNQGRSQEFDLGGYKWVKETKQPHKKLRQTDFGGLYIPIYPRRYGPAGNAYIILVFNVFFLFFSYKRVRDRQTDRHMEDQSDRQREGRTERVMRPERRPSNKHTQHAVNRICVSVYKTD